MMHMGLGVWINGFGMIEPDTRPVCLCVIKWLHKRPEAS